LEYTIVKVIGIQKLMKKIWNNYNIIIKKIKLDHFPNFWAENKTSLKPPPSNIDTKNLPFS